MKKNEIEISKIEHKPDTKVKTLLIKGKEDINNIFQKEEQKIGKMFDKYRNDINILQQIGETSREKYATLHKKIELDLPKLEMINYRHYEPPKSVERDIGVLQKKNFRENYSFY